jgi:hypothetical protein
MGLVCQDFNVNNYFVFMEKIGYLKSGDYFVIHRINDSVVYHKN